MTHPYRFLGDGDSPASTDLDSSDSMLVNSDFIVILAAFLCALICFLGLLAVARCCAWLRRLSSTSAAAASQPPPLALSKANKGLKKKFLRSLPTLTYTQESAAKFSDCAICLAEFSDGEEIRALPQCGHVFHVACIDKWLGSHSSCPSCRRILASTAGLCEKWGNFPASSRSTSSSASEAETRLTQREDSDANSFLP